MTIMFSFFGCGKKEVSKPSIRTDSDGDGYDITLDCNDSLLQPFIQRMRF